MKVSVYKIVLPVGLVLMIGCKPKEGAVEMPVYDNALLQQIRMAAAVIPGDLPTQINYLKYAASIRQWKDVLEDGSNDACTMARTAFQVQYAQGWVMVDAGMDRAVHHFFEKERPQPFDDAGAEKVARAVQQARLVLITHEHGDHVAGVVRNANPQITGKTILTKEQVESLVNHPQMPEIKLTEAQSRAYMVVDFASILPVAPGMVLIKAPGHTNGEIMVYAKLQNGREYIFTGDVSWCYRGVAENRQKPGSEIKRVGEDKKAIGQQLAWLQERLMKDKITILVSHDDIMLPQLAAQGWLGTDLVVN